MSLWTIELQPSNDFVQSAVADDTLLVSRGFRLAAYDVTKGDLLWQLPEYSFVSNLVVENQKLYVLNSDAALLIIDIVTGEIVEQVQFEAPTDQTMLLNGPGQIGGSWLDVSEDLVVIFFQDTDVLMMMEIK